MNPAAAPGLAAPTDQAALAAKFRYWQYRTLIFAMVGYAAFYFVRKNLSLAMPAMEADIGVKKTDLGLFLTLHGLLYGVSRFVNGMWADRSNARYFMVAGLMLSVIANVGFGFSSQVLWLGVFWMINGWVQGMGFPPCCRLMTHWFKPSELATKMGIWNTSHSIGAAIASVVCGYLVVHLGWRWSFFGPALICTFIGLILFVALRDTPRSVGLPEIQVEGAANDHQEDRSSVSYKEFIKRQIFLNPFIWYISLANFFLYILRFAVLDWGPTLLKEMKHFPVHKGGWMVAAFEGSGILGVILAGWITDRFFGGRGSRTCVFCMFGASLAMFAFWKLGNTATSATAYLAIAGFFLYGPQALIGIIAANLSTRRAAATGAGFTGLFGYASTLVSGYGVGYVVQTYGWNTALGMLLSVGALSAFMFILAWPAKAHGYDEKH